MSCAAEGAPRRRVAPVAECPRLVPALRGVSPSKYPSGASFLSPRRLVSTEPRELSSSRGSGDTSALIANFGADPCFSSPELYFTPLSKACLDGLEKVARHLVKRHGVRPTTRTYDVLRCCLTMVRRSTNRALERFIVRELYDTRRRATRKNE